MAASPSPAPKLRMPSDDCSRTSSPSSRHAFYVDALYAATLHSPEHRLVPHLRLARSLGLERRGANRLAPGARASPGSTISSTPTWSTPALTRAAKRVSLGGQILSLLQGGRVQSYLRMIGIALIALAGLPAVGSDAMNAFPWLTVLTLLPLVGALVVLSLRPHQHRSLAPLALDLQLRSRWPSRCCCGPLRLRIRRAAISASTSRGSPPSASSITSASTAWAC